MIPPVVDQAWLQAHPEAVVADVRFYLDGRSGAEAYALGHLPGAVFVDLEAGLAGPASPEELRRRFAGVDDAADVISYCGSGITACHNLIAMEHAGLGRGRLYPGSWSQYSHTDRPVATG